jgi:hypothetical protein
MLTNVREPIERATVRGGAGASAVNASDALIGNSPHSALTAPTEGRREMINCSLSQLSKILRLGGPLVLTSILAASCHWPWPGITENYDGLDRSAIGQFLIENWNSREDTIARGIKDILATSISGKHDPRSAVESIGMHCDSLPSTTCNYVGSVAFWFDGLPKNSPHRSKKTIVTVYIKLSSYANLNSVIVRKEEVEV